MPEEEGEAQCVFCMIGQNKIPSAKVYDDEQLSVFLDIRPATEGHMQVIPKSHAPLFSMLNPETRSKIFSVALSIGSSMVKKLGAEGVTYLINEGQGAGQKLSHASLQIIPRYKDDGVNISWEQKEMGQEEVNDYLQNLMSKLQAEVHEKKPAEKKVEKKEEKKKDEDVTRIPERIPRYW